MKRAVLRSLLVLAAAALLAGCTTYQKQSSRERSLEGVKHFFVLSNLNDNHALDHQIAVALERAAREVDKGPLTMMPDDTQALVSYEDHWTWDFGDHLVYLQIEARDPRSNQIFATVRFTAKFPTRKPTETIIGELVTQLLARRQP